MKKISLFMTLIFIFTGCYDKVEIEDRALVTAIAFDCTEDNNFRISLEIPYTSSLANSESSSEDLDKLKHVDTSVSPSIDLALQDLNSKSPKNLYFGHTKSCVISKNVLKEPKLFMQTVNYLKKDKELNQKINITVSSDDVSDILDTQTDNQPLFGVFLNNYYKNSHLTENLTHTFPLDLNTLLQNLISTTNTVIPITSLDDDSVIISECALIKNYEYAGRLNEKQTEGYLYLANKNPTGDVCIFYNDTPVPVSVTSSETSLSLDPSTMICEINVNINGKTSIMPDEEFNSLCGEKIEEIISGTLEVLQKKYKTDCISYSEYVRKNYPEVYNKYSTDINNIFLDTDFKINVTFSVKNSPNLV